MQLPNDRMPVWKRLSIDLTKCNFGAHIGILAFRFWLSSNRRIELKIHAVPNKDAFIAKAQMRCFVPKTGLSQSTKLSAGLKAEQKNSAFGFKPA